MKAGFSIIIFVAAIGVVITICQVQNSPIIIQPFANKNYFLYRIYIKLHVFFGEIGGTFIAFFYSGFNGFKSAIITRKNLFSFQYLHQTI